MKSMKKKLNNTESVRQRIDKQSNPKKRRQIKTTVSKISSPIKSVLRFLTKEYSLPLKTPDNKFGRMLSKNRRVIPKFFKDAWNELKLVSWPTKKETTRLTTAVFVFASLFGIAIWLVDLGLDNIFRKVLIK